MAFHLALLVDSLSAGNNVPVWREDVVSAFIQFQAEVAEARLHYRETIESLPPYERFGRLLAGSGSDTADVIRIRHSCLLSAVYPKIRIIPRDPNRSFDALEKEVIWNRDRGLCQNPDCPRPGRRVSFRDATVHHVVEHAAGGQTTLQNGVLVCPECHAFRTDMQRLSPQFQSYLARLYADGGRPAFDECEFNAEDEESTGPPEPNENHARAKLKIVIDWAALDVDRETQTICERQASDSILKLLTELIATFGKAIEQQLTTIPVCRYPLSATPATAFVNRATGQPISALKLPDSELYFCPISSNPEKVKRLKKLFSRLTLPDGRGFSPGSVEISVDAEST